MSKVFRRLLKIAIFAGFVGALWFGWMQRQAAYDWLQLRNYHPNTAIVTLADDTAMNEHARRVFYVNHPSIEDGSTFNTYCREDEQTIVLGCYLGGQSGIHIYDVQEAKLAGIKEVTAAHEMLHAMHERLNKKERERIDALLVDYYQNHVTDQRIKDNVEAYRSKDASVVPNELHSILGTEVRTLSPELEEYYKQYFTDRSKVVTYSEQYEGIFEELKQQITAYQAKIADLKEQISSLEVSLQADHDSLVAEDARLDALKAEKSFQEYNAGVTPFNKHLASYNASVNKYDALIGSFNKTVEDYNATVIERTSLEKSIDSKYQKL
jgi:chromosome segregation ATPase